MEVNYPQRVLTAHFSSIGSKASYSFTRSVIHPCTHSFINIYERLRLTLLSVLNKILPVKLLFFLRSYNNNHPTSYTQ